MLHARRAGFAALALSAVCAVAPNAIAQPPATTPAAPATTTPAAPTEATPAPATAPATPTPAPDAAPTTTPAPPAPAPPVQQHPERVAPPRLDPNMLKKFAPPPPPKLPANVIATVDGKPITREDLLSMVELTHGQALLTQLVTEAVLEDNAQKLGVSVKESDLQAAIADLKDKIVQSEMRNGTPMTFEQFAQQRGITPMVLRWRVYEDLLRKGVYAKSLQKSIPPLAAQIKVAHILILTVQPSNEAATKPRTDAEQAKIDADAKVKIDGIYSDIKAGKITFEDAAKKYSEDQADAPQGGELPWATRGTFDPTFDNAAWGLTKKGEVTGPIKSKFGWHLIKLIVKGSNATPAEVHNYNLDQQQQIAQQLANPDGQQYQEAVKSWMQGLLQSANIVVNPTPIIVASPKSPLSGAHIVADKKATKK